MIKILHIADVHFGNNFLNKNEELSNLLILGIEKSFKKAVDFSINNNIDLLIIAGDLFDSKDIAYRIKQFVLSEFERLEKHKINIAYALGNHDCVLYQDDYFIKNLPSNVIVFDSEKVKKVTLNSIDNTPYEIIGIGHSKEIVKENLIRNFPVKHNDIVTIGIAHCNVYSANGIGKEEKYLPTSFKDLEIKNYDYWALGHMHKRDKLSERIIYSGSLQGLSIKEIGSKGGTFITIGENNFEENAIEFAEIIWREEKITVDESINSIDSLRNFVSEYFINLDIKSNEIIRLIVDGECKLKRNLISKEDILFLENYFKDKYNLKNIEMIIGISYKYNLEKYKIEKNFLGYFLNNFKSDDIENLVKSEELYCFDNDIKTNTVEFEKKVNTIKNKIIDTIIKY
ncbi:metallophosphoesterase family protein [Helicovermis profundi]|uniref:Calcineurin-like phosphoesterase domain-containing protein n=1 Tax=Helicovermis profundi TaxID=3065157 RepID=A0AAU9E5G0_9FIRM|nr:hypothetical protein HLPR_08890 [Clostridia bacterium S502]